MHTERVLTVALIACACLPLVTLAAGAADSPYRLNSPEPQAFRLGDGRPYQLAEEYRLVPGPAGPQADQPPPGPEVSAGLAAKPYSKEIGLAARRAALDPAFVHAIIHVESRHQHQAVSPKGAIGLMQVLPETAARYGIANPRRSPQANLTAGTLYVRDLMQMFDARLDLVLAAYNAGEGAVQRHANRIPPYRETQSYVRAVLAKYREWRPRAPWTIAPRRRAASGHALNICRAHALSSRPRRSSWGAEIAGRVRQSSQREDKFQHENHIDDQSGDQERAGH